jgi:hypothetical protein
MTHKNRIAEEVEKTLQAYDNDPLLQPSPYLLTRIKAGMKKGRRNNAEAQEGRIRPALVMILFIILLNIITLSYSLQMNAHETLQQALIQQLETEMQFDRSVSIF